MKVWSVEWPEGLMPGDGVWSGIARSFSSGDGILVTNEMPFGFWQPTSQMFNVERAREWADLHERGLDSLADLKVKAVISSRPILNGSRLANEAFALVEGRYEALHQKHYFPAENGWQEQSWFETREGGFHVARIAGLDVGLLLCTEVMFPEKARWLGRLGADLIAVPRATGTEHHIWRTALSMAAIVSGAYVASSNRVGTQGASSPRFGGGGLMLNCDGFEVAMTDAERPVVQMEVDRILSSAAKSRYPVYVREPDAADIPISRVG